MTSSQAGPSRPRALEPLRPSSNARSTISNTDADERRSKTFKAFTPVRPSKKAEQSSTRIVRKSQIDATQSQNAKKGALEPLRITRAKQIVKPVQQPTAKIALEPIKGRRDKADQSTSASDDVEISSSTRQANSSLHRKRALEPIQPRQIAKCPQDRVQLNEMDIVPAQKKIKALEPIKLRSASLSDEKKSALWNIREPTRLKTDTTPEIEVEETKERKANSKALIPIKTRPRAQVEVEMKGEDELKHSKVMIPIRSRLAVDVEDKKKCKAHEPLQRSEKQPMDQLCAGTRAYAALDHAKHAIKVMCYDLQRMKPCTNRNGISLGTFRHLNRETVFVHIVGRIVGIEEKDHKVKWLIDDGSAVVAAHHAYDPRPVVVQQDVTVKVDKGKRRAVEENDDSISGIPSEYIRPATPTKAPKRESKIDAILRASSNNQKFEHTYRHISICSLVSVVGRVDSWFKGEMIVQVDRIIPPGLSKDEKTVRAPREGYIELLNNPNVESDHIHNAVLLSETEYANDNGSVSIEALQDKNAADQSKPSSAGTQSEGEHRNLQLKRKTGEDGTESESRKTRQNDENKIVEPPQASADVEGLTTLSEQNAQQRRMRDFRKIPDRQINDQLLRIYVQKHISDYCRQPHDSRQHTKEIMPPAFTIDYLQRVTSLRLLADRVIDIAIKKREAKRRKIDGHNTTSSTVHPVRDTGKRQRLFESVIRNILADGMVVVSDSRKQSPLPPFDGEKPKDFAEFLRTEQGKLLDWEDVKNEHSICKFTPTKVSGDFVTAKQMQTEEDISMMRWRGSHKAAQSKGQEVYQVVTPNLLTQPIREVLEYYSADEGKRINYTLHSLSADKIKERLRLLDDRWQYIRPESVAESIADMLAHL